MSHEKKPIHIVTYNKKSFVVGLEWRAIKGGLHFMKEVKAIGKREHLDVVAIRQNGSIQAGFAPRFSVPLKGKYSLAVSLVSLISGKWLAVIPVESMEDHYIVIASTIFILSVLYFLNEYWDHQEHKARLMAVEKQKLADDINRAARYQSALLSLKPPWVDKPSVQHFIEGCDKKYRTSLCH